MTKLTDAEHVLYYFGAYITYHLSLKDETAEYYRGCAWYYIGFGA